MKAPVDSTTARSQNGYIFAALVVFCINSALSIAFIDPKTQGWVDSERGWAQFNALLAGGYHFFGPDNQIPLRLGMVIVTLLVLLVLSSLRLVEQPVLVTYLALPYSAYLATKLKMEFLFFPFAAVKVDLPPKQEAAVIVCILVSSVLLGENNGFIIACYRVLLLLFKARRPNLLVVAGVIGAILWVDANLRVLYPIIPQLGRYEWTRTYINPEYSVPETVIVFVASMVFSVNPHLDYVLAIPFSIAIILPTLSHRLLSSSFYKSSLRHPGFIATVLTVLLFTSITHAFQNARYYYFFLTLYPKMGGAWVNAIIIVTSVPMMGLMVFFYMSQ